MKQDFFQPEINFDIPAAIQQRDLGIERAINHADRVCDDWGDKAYSLLLDFIKVTSEFMTEDFRLSTEGKLPEPPDNRAYGALIVRAKKNGLIRHLRYEAAKDKKSHRNPKSVWGKI